jgi:hypothetical protein
MSIPNARSADIQPLDTDVGHPGRHVPGGRGRVTHRIDVTTKQVVAIELEPGDVISSESGGKSWMTSNMELKSHSGGGFASPHPLHPSAAYLANRSR